MQPADRTRLRDALAYALEAHGDQTRRGVPIPYASHLLQVAGLVLEHGGDAEQAAAALLHDTLEDCPGVSPAELARRFGPGVERIVRACSDTLPGDAPDRKSPWRERKRRFLERLAGADARSALVCLCDKRHNLASLVADLRAEGVGTLARFNASPVEQIGYFEALLATLGDRVPPRLRDETAALLAEFRALAGGDAPGR